MGRRYGGRLGSEPGRLDEEPRVDVGIVVAGTVVEVLGAEPDGVLVRVVHGVADAEDHLGRDPAQRSRSEAGIRANERAGRIGLLPERHVGGGPERHLAQDVEVPEAGRKVETEARPLPPTNERVGPKLNRAENDLGPRAARDLPQGRGRVTLPRRIVEEREAVEVPALRLPGDVELHHRRAGARVEGGERISPDRMEVVRRVPEAADAPLHVLLAHGDEDGARDVEVHPELIEHGPGVGAV
jgi:hypothetical protein